MSQQLDERTGSEQWGNTRPRFLWGQLPRFAEIVAVPEGLAITEMLAKQLICKAMRVVQKIERGVTWENSWLTDAVSSNRCSTLVVSVLTPALWEMKRSWVNCAQKLNNKWL